MKHTPRNCEMLKEISKENVIIRDRRDLENKLGSLVSDGAEKLQVIADFDSTLTKAVVDGKVTAHTLDIFSRIETFSQKFRDDCAAQSAFYGPKSVCAELTYDEKQDVFSEWWEAYEALSIGEKMTMADLRQAVDTINTPLRDGCVRMLSLLLQHQIPLVVVSAGFGEIIEYVLQDFEPKIVSNFIRLDDNGFILGFTRPHVSVYNKHKITLPVDKNRHNVLLLGDSEGDSYMADNVPDTKTVLKIGFLTDGDEKKLERYRNQYDIVLVNDETMDTVMTILTGVVGLQ